MLCESSEGTGAVLVWERAVDVVKMRATVTQDQGRAKACDRGGAGTGSVVATKVQRTTHVHKRGAKLAQT